MCEDLKALDIFSGKGAIHRAASPTLNIIHRNDVERAFKRDLFGVDLRLRLQLLDVAPTEGQMKWKALQPQSQE